MIPSPDHPARVLVVDDSATARQLIRALIDDAPGLEVCGEAWNGSDAVQKVVDLAPDLVTMDLQMPVMGGMEAISEIMGDHATRILVLSDVADAAHAMAAVARGALEATGKPTIDDGPAFTARLRMLTGVPVIRHLRPRQDQGTAGIAASAGSAMVAGQAPAQALPLIDDAGAMPRRLVVIAASTGGPQALAQLLPALPTNFPVPIVIAQHIADGFAAGMAHWLDTLCALRVSVARHGEQLLPGHVYLADPASHLTITAQFTACLVPRVERDVYRPSCDRLLSSAADALGAQVIGVILTGMGRDGAGGMVAIANAGGVAIAQDEASSVVYGMNREAVASGCVAHVLPLPTIAAELCSLLRQPAGTAVHDGAS